jgi:hypothetical protein
VRRLASVLGVCLLLIAGVVPAQASGISSALPQANPLGRVLGIVPVRDARGGARPTRSSNLTYHNGSTMNTNTTYAIFWAGASLTFDSGYQTLIDTYFTDVSHDSGLSSNVYASDTQYYDTITFSTRYIQYASTFGGFYVDTTPYPLNGCTDKATSICLSDAQLQNRIAADVGNPTGWSGGNGTAPTGGESQLVFIFTPKGVGSCIGSSCAYTQYCAYHSWIDSTSTNPLILYANQPYANQNYRIYTCNSGQWPNGNSADATLNVVSHEHNEAITDQQGKAWYDSSGNEDGDKCAWNFGTALGSTSTGNYNQLINGHTYYLQQEWSNAANNNAGGCVLSY